MTTFRRDGPVKTGTSVFHGRSAKRSASVFKRDGCSTDHLSTFEPDGCKPEEVVPGLPAPSVFVRLTGLPAPRVTVRKVGDAGRVSLPAPRVIVRRVVVTDPTVEPPVDPTPLVGLPAPTVTVSVGTLTVVQGSARVAASVTTGLVAIARGGANVTTSAGAGRVAIARGTANVAAEVHDPEGQVAIARGTAAVVFDAQVQDIADSSGFLDGSGFVLNKQEAPVFLILYGENYRALRIEVPLVPDPKPAGYDPLAGGPGGRALVPVTNDPNVGVRTIGGLRPEGGVASHTVSVDALDGGSPEAALEVAEDRGEYRIYALRDPDDLSTAQPIFAGAVSGLPLRVVTYTTDDPPDPAGYPEQTIFTKVSAEE